MGDVQIRLQQMNNGSKDSSNDESNNGSFEENSFVVPELSVELPKDSSEAVTADSTEALAEGAAETPPAAEETVSSVSDDTLIAAMESILFAMGEAVPIESIAQALCVPKSKALEMADVLADRYRSESSGVSLNWYEESVQLSTKPELYEYLIRIAAEPKKPKLTPTLLETLSIIAFRQPVTRMEVENIRGVNSDFAINRLISFDLVEEVGRKEVPGRPLLFGTTQQFLRSFGIRSVEELPEPDTSHMEAFREEAEEEVSSKLDI